GNRKYEYMGRRHAGKEIVTMNERRAKTCRQYKCRYFKADVTFEGVELRLFFIHHTELVYALGNLRIRA
ncbi:MAG: hypothetical protein IJS59_01680, partial [Bacteroidaceae bacterium]|nr:hypothetical protein [Bacteroidaceae bacterium]